MIETMDNITLDLFREHDAAPAIFKGDKWDRLSEILKNDPDLNFKEGDSPSMSERVFAAIEGIKDALLQGYTLQIGYSGGKDSSGTLLLVLFAMVNLVRSGKGHLLSPYSWVGHTDTGIENPEVRYLADKTLAALQRFIQEENLPLTVAIARPGLTSSWPGRILTGRGLPTFVVSSARQCSNDLKVLPAKKMVANSTPKCNTRQIKQPVVVHQTRSAVA